MRRYEGRIFQAQRHHDVGLTAVVVCKTRFGRYGNEGSAWERYFNPGQAIALAAPRIKRMAQLCAKNFGIFWQRIRLSQDGAKVVGSMREKFHMCGCLFSSLTVDD